MSRFPRVPVFLCLLSLVSHPGCTIRENRDLCPALLVLEFPPLEEPAMLLLTTETGRRADVLPAGLTEYRAVVERGNVTALVRSPAELPFSAGQETRIPEGEDCPEFRLFAGNYEIRGEMLRDSVRMHKSYCTLDLRVTSRDGSAPYSFTVQGGWCGYDAAGRALSGLFRCRLRPDPEGRGSLRLPRQGDDSLLLDLVGEDGVLRSFALGEYLRESGYDWTAEDLEDAGIVIDYARTSVTLVIGNWSKTLPFDMII